MGNPPSRKVTNKTEDQILAPPALLLLRYSLLTPILQYPPSLAYSSLSRFNAAGRSGERGGVGGVDNKDKDDSSGVLKYI